MARSSDERWTAGAILVCLYAIFIVWFCGFPMAPTPITEVDAEHYRDAFKGKMFDEEMAAHDFEAFLSNDDGTPVTVTARLLIRDEVRYPETLPPGVEPRETVDDALSAFVWGMYQIAVPRGTVSMTAMRDPLTLFRSIEHTAADLDAEDGDGEQGGGHEALKQKWSVEWTFRFRCRKDVLDTLLEAERTGVWYHKVAAVRAVDVSVSQRSIGYHITPTFMVQVLVAFALLVIYDFTEGFFPESPDIKELKKLRKRVKKLEGKLEKTKTSSKDKSGDETTRVASDDKDF